MHPHTHTWDVGQGVLALGLGGSGRGPDFGGLASGQRYSGECADEENTQPHKQHQLQREREGGGRERDYSRSTYSP